MDAHDLLARGPFAHRGLWSPDGPPENSLAAFEAAAEAGYGMELDVRLSADDEAIVFHDETLDRMTGVRGAVRDRPSDALAAVRLRTSEETIPTLSQALATVAGRTPVLVELKTRQGDEGPLERRVAELLSDYAGPAAVLSFNPVALAVVADAAPSLLRGLNSAPHVTFDAEVVASGGPPPLAGLDQARPHFLSLGKALLTGARPHHLPIVGWTIRSRDELLQVEAACDTVMFEGFRA